MTSSESSCAAPTVALLLSDRSSSDASKFGGALFCGDMSCNVGTQEKTEEVMAALCEEGKLNPELLQVSLDAMTCRHVAGVKPRTDRDTAISNAVESAMKVIQCLPTSPSSKTRVCINSVPGGMKHLVASTLAKRLGSTVFVAEELAAVYKAYKRLGFEGFAGSDGELYSFKNPDALQVHLVHHLKFDTGEHFQDFATAAAESNGSEDMLNLLCLQTSGFYRDREDITYVHPELPVCARLMRTTYSDHSRPATSKDKVKMLTGLGCCIVL